MGPPQIVATILLKLLLYCSDMARGNETLPPLSCDRLKIVSIRVKNGL